jgi:hypothetical protein
MGGVMGETPGDERSNGSDIVEFSKILDSNKLVALI